MGYLCSALMAVVSVTLLSINDQWFSSKLFFRVVSLDYNHTIAREHAFAYMQNTPDL